MTQTIVKTLYGQDFNLWLEETAARLKARDFDNLDIDNLLEEIEGLATSDRRELRNRLITLLEHILKRCYVAMPNECNGWERTIREQRRKIKSVLEDSPSLKNYLPEIFDRAFDGALAEVRAESGYSSVEFPDAWRFSRDVNAILDDVFWHEGDC